MTKENRVEWSPEMRIAPKKTTDAIRDAYASVIMVMSPIDISPTASASASPVAADREPGSEHIRQWGRRQHTFITLPVQINCRSSLDNGRIIVLAHLAISTRVRPVTLVRVEDLMPLVNQRLCAISKLELVISRHLVIGEDGDVAHDFTDLRELEVLNINLVVCFDGGEELVVGGHVLQEQRVGTN